MHLNSQLLFDRNARACFSNGLRVLEIGPDGFPSSFRQRVPGPITWDTADIYESPQLTYSKADVYALPIPDRSYDIVFSAQVIEHVPKVWKWFPELARVTKPGGLVITINPTSWPYHEAPIDCWRIYPEGMKALCEEAGLIPELLSPAPLNSRTAAAPSPAVPSTVSRALRGWAFNCWAISASPSKGHSTPSPSHANR